jgi:hypothetical protein
MLRPQSAMLKSNLGSLGCKIPSLNLLARTSACSPGLEKPSKGGPAKVSRTHPASNFGFFYICEDLSLPYAPSIDLHLLDLGLPYPNIARGPEKCP